MFRKKLAVICAAICCSAPVIAQPLDLEPLDSWGQKRLRWASDPSELGYAATRCGALYGVIGSMFRALGTQDDIKQSSETIARGAVLVLFGNSLAETAGWSKQNLQLRFNGLTESYSQIIKRNRAIQNNMFHGFIEHDWRFCIDLEAAVRDVAKQIQRK